MALIECPECKKMISDTASSCPNCGYLFPKQKSKTFLKNIVFDSTQKRSKKNIPIIATIAVVIIIIITIFIVILSTPQSINASPEAISYGKRVVEAIDGYIDKTISYEDAKKEIEKIIDNFDYLDDMDRNEEHYQEDLTISFEVIHISYVLMVDSHQGDYENQKELFESRDKLAEYVGVK